MIYLIIFILFLVIFTLVMMMCFPQEIRSIKDKDPAAPGTWQIIWLYPGLHAIVAYRIAHKLWQCRVCVLARLLSQGARLLTGIEIHPGAQIGRGLFIDHGMGVVIGETAILGDDVTLFQGVTLGGTGKECGKRHPTLGSRIVVGAGAKVLGNINIGDHSYIGANAVIIRDVPTNSTVVGVPGHVTRRNGEKVDLMDHMHVSDPIMVHMKDLVKRIKKLEDHKNTDHS